MRYSHEQRLQMASMGIDPDQMENPKQKLPPVEQRVKKLKRYIKNHHPRSQKYKEALKVYEMLDNPVKQPDKGFWKTFFGGK